MSHPSSRTRQGYLYVAKYFSPSHFERRWCILEGTLLRVLQDVGQEQCFSVSISQASIDIYKTHLNTIQISPKSKSSTSIYLQTSSISERIAWHAALRHISLTSISQHPPEHLQQLYNNVSQRIHSPHPALTALQCLIQWYMEVEEELERGKQLEEEINKCEGGCSVVRDLAIALHHKSVELAFSRIKFITGLATHISQNLSSVPLLPQTNDSNLSVEYKASFERSFRKERGSKCIEEVQQLQQELHKEMDRKQSWWKEKGRASVLCLLDAAQHEHRRKRIIFRKYRKRRKSKTERHSTNNHDKEDQENDKPHQTDRPIHEDTQALFDLISVWEKLEQASERCVLQVRKRIASTQRPPCPMLVASNTNNPHFIERISRVLASSETLRNLDHLNIDCEQLLQRLALRVCHHLTSELDKHSKTHQEQALIARHLGPAATSPLNNNSLLSVHRAIATRSHLLLAARRAALAQTRSEELRAWINSLEQYESVQLIAGYVLRYGSVRRITESIISSVNSSSMLQRLENDTKKGELQAELSRKFVDSIARAHGGETRALKDVGIYYAQLAQLPDPPFPYLNCFASFARDLAILVHLDRVTVEDALFTNTNLRTVCMEYCECSKQDTELQKICQESVDQEDKIVDQDILQMDTTKAQEKLKELLEIASPTRIAITMVKLGDVLVQSAPRNGPVPADILLPGVILTIIRTQPSNMYTVLSFVRKFGNVHGKCEYFLTCFESAVQFIKDVPHQ